MMGIMRFVGIFRGYILAALLILYGNCAADAGFIITFDNLSNLPARTGSSSFSAANGGSSTLDGVTFSSTFAISGDENVVTAPAGPFLIPHSGNYAGYGYQDTTITTSLLLQSLYLGSTSLDTTGDGATALTIQALGQSNQVLDSISVSGLTMTPTFVDTSSFGAFSGITGYQILVDASGAANPRFSVDDLSFTPVSSVPAPSGLTLASIGAVALLGCCCWRRYRPVIA